MFSQCWSRRPWTNPHTEKDQMFISISLFPFSDNATLSNWWKDKQWKLHYLEVYSESKSHVATLQIHNFFILQTLKFNTGSPKKLKGNKTMMFKYIVRTYSTEKLKRRIVVLKFRWQKLKISGI
jgi:hypothetical protein